MNDAVPVFQLLVESASLIVGILAYIRVSPPPGDGLGSNKSEDSTPRQEEP